MIITVDEANKKTRTGADTMADGQKYTAGQKQTEKHHIDRHTNRKIDWLTDSLMHLFTKKE